MGNLNVWLLDNHLTEDPTDFFGKVKSTGTITNNDLANQMTKEGTKLKEETILDIHARADCIKAEQLTTSYSNNTPLCKAYLKANCIFNIVTENVNKEKHKSRVSISAGSLTHSTFANTKVDCIGAAAVENIIIIIELNL